MAKSVKVHDDTHRALKLLKSRRRSSSLDEVIRGMIKESTGSTAEALEAPAKSDSLNDYLKG